MQHPIETVLISPALTVVINVLPRNFAFLDALYDRPFLCVLLTYFNGSDRKVRLKCFEKKVFTWTDIRPKLSLFGILDLYRSIKRLIISNS